MVALRVNNDVRDTRKGLTLVIHLDISDATFNTWVDGPNWEQRDSNVIYIDRSLSESIASVLMENPHCIRPLHDAASDAVGIFTTLGRRKQAFLAPAIRGLS